MPSATTAQPTVLTGDAYLDILSHTRITASTALPSILRTPVSKAHLLEISAADPDPDITLLPLNEVQKHFLGSATKLAPELDEIICYGEIAADADAQERLGCAGHAQTLKRRYGIEIDTIDALLFQQGYLSVKIRARIPKGWSNGHCETMFRPISRDEIFNVYIEILSAAARAFFNTLQVYFRRLMPRLNTKESKREGTKWIGRLQCADCQDSHLVYGGLVPETFDPSAPLDERYRPLVYPSTNAPLANEDVHRTGYIRLDYAFDVVARPGYSSLLEKMTDISILLRYLHFTYYTMYNIINDTKIKIDTTNIHYKTLRELYYKINDQYTMAKSPTFSHRHEYIIYRKSVMDRWFANDLYERFDHLLNQVASIMESKEAEKRQAVNQRIQYILLAITILSIFGILADLPKLVWIVEAVGM